MESIFKHPDFGAVRTAGSPDNPLFCLSDVCQALGMSNPRKVKARIDAEDTQLIDLHAVTQSYGITSGQVGNSMATFVTESGLYQVILRSDKPQAKPFSRWVTSEVLPAIRRSGGYMMSKPDESPEELMARALKVAEETLDRTRQRLQMAESQVAAQTEEIKQLAPLADYTKDVLQSKSTYTLTQVSKDLGFCSVHAFTAWAKKLKVLYRQSETWMPNSRFSGKGFFCTRTCKFVKSDNTIGSSMSTVVTEAGRAMLHALLEQKGEVAL